jgi:hypothetical protein
MVGVGGVTHAEEETDAEDGEGGGHCLWLGAIVAQVALDC